jgi:site-specific recombinase XerC
MRLSDALKAFVLDLKQAGTSPETLKWYDWHIAALGKGLCDLEIHKVTTEHLRAHIAAYRDSGVSAYTVAGRDRALRAFWRWVTDEYALDRNPMKNVRKSKLPPLEPAAADSAAFDAVLATCENDYAGVRDRAILMLMSDSGARRGGVVGLQVSDLDLAKRLAWVREKGKPARAVFFTVATKLALATWLNMREAPPNESAVFVSLKTGCAMHGNALNQMINRRKRLARVKGRVNPHSHRHAVGIAFGMAGQVTTGAAVLGDSIGVFGDYYQRFDTDDLAESYDKVMSSTRFLK